MLGLLMLPSYVSSLASRTYLLCLDEIGTQAHKHMGIFLDPILSPTHQGCHSMRFYN